jgi:hypothetical protein
MELKMIKIFGLLICLLSTFFISEIALSNDYSQFEIGANIKVLNINSTPKLRIYIFTDDNACAVCNYNIFAFQNNLKNFNIEFNIFLNNSNIEQTIKIKNENQWIGNIISDEYGSFL